MLQQFITQSIRRGWWPSIRLDIDGWSKCARVFLGGVALGAFALGCASSGSVGGGRARDFSLRDLTGRTVRLSDHLGKDVVLLHFWATWCAPCMASLPHLDRMYRAQRAAGFVVLAISVDGPETAADVAPTAHRLDLSFPVLVDEETRVVASYNPRRDVPFTVIIDREGAVVKSTPGHASSDEVALEKLIQSLLAGPEAP